MALTHKPVSLFKKTAKLCVAALLVSSKSVSGHYSNLEEKTEVFYGGHKHYEKQQAMCSREALAFKSLSIEGRSILASLQLPPQYMVDTVDEALNQKSVMQLVALHDHEIALLLDDGTVEACGHPNFVKHFSLQKAQFSNVQSMVAAGDLVAFISKGGFASVFEHYEGTLTPLSSDVNKAFSNIKMMTGDSDDIAALKTDGSVALFKGSGSVTELSGDLSKRLSKVRSLLGNGGNFAAFKEDGSIVLFDYLGHEISVSDELALEFHNLVGVVGDGDFAAALKQDGSVVLFGNYDGLLITQESDLKEQLFNISELSVHSEGFSARRADGILVHFTQEGELTSTSEEPVDVH